MCRWPSSLVGMVANVSIAGPRARSGASRASVSSCGSRTTASTTTNDWPDRNGGRSGSRGKRSMRPTDVTSFGTVRTHSRHACSTSAARSIGKKRTPAFTSVNSNSRNSIAVTTPNEPPPPRSAQKSSGSFSASTRRCTPSAVTSSIASTLLAASPRERACQLMPPPRLYPTTPTSGAEPASAVSPCSKAFGTTSIQSAPASARARFAVASIVTPRIIEVLSRIVPSSGPSGAALWPVPCGATRSPRAHAASMVAWTSATEAARTTAVGRWSTSRCQA